MLAFIHRLVQIILTICSLCFRVL